MRKNKQNKGQVTIFIVIALIIVAGLLIIFLIWRKPTLTVFPETNPSAYIEKCMKDYGKEAIEILSEQGGDIEPEGSIRYKDKNITYLCYNANYYVPCVNQRPMLIEHIEQEITNYLEPKMRSCFSSLRDELEKRGYTVSMGEMNIVTGLQTRKVSITAERSLKLTKNNEVRNFEKFKASLANPIYDLAKIAMEISNQESHYCNFDVLGFMILYPKYDIKKFREDDSTIYILKEVASGEEFTFAIRSCAVRAGL